MSALPTLARPAQAGTHPTIFTFAGLHGVRVVGTPSTPWFVAKDVCQALEIQNVSQALKALQDDEKGVCNSYTPGGAQDLLTISESGVYAMIFRSRKAVAQQFRKWVTSEVLPAIRRTGTYNAPAPTAPAAIATRAIHVHHHYPEPPPAQGEEDLAVMLCDELLGGAHCRDVISVSRDTILDVAYRENAFAEWFGGARVHPSLPGARQSFFQHLRRYCNRWMRSPFVKGEYRYYFIKPDGQGRQRRYVIYRQLADRPPMEHAVLCPATEAQEIVFRALNVGEKVIVR